MTRINWKKRALEAEARAERAEDYAQDYGNASGMCQSGYWQHPNYICHRCNADRSINGGRCGLPKGEK